MTCSGSGTKQRGGCWLTRWICGTGCRGLWQKVCVGGIVDWQARKIAQATRPLTAPAAGCVDRRLDPWTGQLSWGRLQTLLDAEIVAADPARAAQLAVEAETAMGVWAGQTNGRGVKAVYARTDPGSAAWFLGVVNRIADILAADGDTRTADRRRAAAIGILAQPARACALLAGHARDTVTVPEGVHTASASIEQPLWDPTAEPDPDIDQACIAEWVETVDEPAAHPVPTELIESDDPHCSCGATTDRPEPDTGLDLNAAVVDPKAARPKVVLHFHLSHTGLSQAGGDTLVRPEHADPMLLRELTAWLAGTGCQIRIQPVIDPATTAPADAYEIPDRIRQAVRYRQIADVSPWGSSTRRSLDLDHLVPYRTGGPPGQTRATNLAPLNRSAHRTKTLGLKRVRQPDPGVYLWRTKHGHLNLVTNRGTINLGRTEFSHALWRLATQHCLPAIAA